MNEQENKWREQFEQSGYDMCSTKGGNWDVWYAAKQSSQSIIDAQAKRIEELENDAKRLDWLEDQYGLHKEAEITYIVDGYEIEITYDGNPTDGIIYNGDDLRLAIDAAMAKEQPK